MALETVTFKLEDFAGKPRPDLHLRVLFIPNGAAIGGDTLFISPPIVVDTFQDDGSGEVELQDTHSLWLITGEDVWYDVRVERFAGTYSTAFGGQAIADYIPWDYPGWELRVPPGGGELAALVRAPTNPAQIFVGPGRSPGSNDDEPVQVLLPSTYTGWYRTNTLPIEGVRNYFEWGD
ncbi:MAG: hypothetical protein PIR02_15880 [Microbacterium enclense]